MLVPEKHPRVRGEDVQPWDPDDDIPETPPRARGRRFLALLESALRGNTPACAGKTFQFIQPDRPMGKHPRVRGEDHVPPRFSALLLETPPRARGRPGINQASNFFFRNTPACAGKTRRCHNRGMARWKHPRVRGEDLYTPLHSTNALETPPRARGRQLMTLDETREFRNTPACAGKTICLCL